VKRLFQQAVAKYRLYARAPQLQAKVAELEDRITAGRMDNARLISAGITRMSVVQTLRDDLEAHRRRANTAEATLTRLRTVLNAGIGPWPPLCGGPEGEAE